MEVERELLHAGDMAEPLDELVGVAHTLLDSPRPPDEVRRPHRCKADLERETARLSSVLERALERVHVRIRLAAPCVNGGDASPRGREHLMILHRFARGDSRGRLLEHALQRALGILHHLHAGEPDPPEPLGVPVSSLACERHALLERSLRPPELVGFLQGLAETHAEKRRECLRRGRARRRG